ncbi:MAG TPA: YciI family protein [Thermoleophilia bacterium]|jgi:hypothetical protein|nr:YciI family protein [Thermoleophilia bacterium]
MKQYLITMYQPDGVVPPPEVLEPVMRKLGEINDEARAAGQWVFSGGLHDASATTVLRVADGETLITDGPYIEGKEHIGGLYILRATDLDAALAFTEKVARATGLPMEVRPFRFQE